MVTITPESQDRADSIQKVIYMATKSLMQFILTVKSCQDPGTPWRGNKNGNLHVGQTLHFSCDQCYKLTGSPNRTCQSGLSWSGSQPTCTGMFEDFNFTEFHFSTE